MMSGIKQTRGMYLTLYLTLCGLTRESIILWGLGLIRLVHEKPTLVCLNLSSLPLKPLKAAFTVS